MYTERVKLTKDSNSIFGLLQTRIMDNISSSEIVITLSRAFKSLDVNVEGEIPISKLINCIRKHVEEQALETVHRKRGQEQLSDLQESLKNAKSSFLNKIDADDKGALVTIKKPGQNLGAVGTIQRVVNNVAYVKVSKGPEKGVVGPIDLKDLEKDQAHALSDPSTSLKIEKIVGETIHDWMLHSEFKEIRKEPK